MTFISRIANTCAYFFILLTFILTIVCVIGIWGEFDEVIGKTFASLGLIAFALFVILAIDGSGSTKKVVSQEIARAYMQTLEIFLYIRKISFAVIIFSVTTCVFFGLLSIWEVLKGEVLFKTLATLGSIGFYALITVAVCKQRESSIKAINVESSVGAIAETLQPAPLAQSVVEQPKATPVQVI